MLRFHGVLDHYVHTDNFVQCIYIFFLHTYKFLESYVAFFRRIHYFSQSIWLFQVLVVFFRPRILKASIIVVLVLILLFFFHPLEFTFTILFWLFQVLNHYQLALTFYFCSSFLFFYHHIYQVFLFVLHYRQTHF